MIKRKAKYIADFFSKLKYFIILKDKKHIFVNDLKNNLN